MTAPVFVVASHALSGAAAGSLVRLDGPEGRHAAAVLRLQPGEQLRLVDGEGTCAEATVAAVVDRQALDVRVDRVAHEALPVPRLVVVQGLPKGDRGELAVELLTEVGVDAIIPWSAASCIAHWRGDRRERAHRRWSDAAQAAAKQSRRSRFPVVEDLASTADVIVRLRKASLALVLDETAAVPLSSAALPMQGEVVVVVGPEGGITQEERRAFVDAGATCVRLGPGIMRTSSAGMAALAVLLSRSPRWTDLAPAPATIAGERMEL